MRGIMILSACIIAASVAVANATVLDVTVTNTDNNTVLGHLNVTRGVIVGGFEEFDFKWASFLGPATGSQQLNLGGTWTALGSGTPAFNMSSLASWPGKTTNFATTVGTPPAPPASYINMDSTVGTFTRGPQASGTSYTMFDGSWFITPGNGLELSPTGGVVSGYDTTLLASLFVTPGADISFNGAAGFSYGGGTTPHISFSTVVAVPEPGTLSLLGAAAMGLLVFAWRRRK